MSINLINDIQPNIYCIQSTYENRLIRLFLLVGKEKILLIDSGLAYTPNEVIIPCLDQLGIPVKKIDWLVVTHASGDHFGGNSELKNIHPGMQIISHELDAPSITCHSTYIDNHINIFRDEGVPYPELNPKDPSFIALHGLEASVDWIVKGNEKLILDENWSVELIHTPGHTPGHLMVYDPLNKCLFAGDGIMGMGIPEISGDLVMPPCYFEVDWYLDTIKKLRQLSPVYIFGTHYPNIVGDEANDFLDTSENFVFKLQEIILNVLEKAQEPLDMPSIINRVRREFKIPNAVLQYGMSIHAHLKKLLHEGIVVKEGSTPKYHWKLS